MLHASYKLFAEDVKIDVVPQCECHPGKVMYAPVVDTNKLTEEDRRDLASITISSNTEGASEKS